MGNAIASIRLATVVMAVMDLLFTISLSLPA